MGVVLSNGTVFGLISINTRGVVEMSHVPPEPKPISKLVPVNEASLADTEATLHGWIIQ